MSALYTITFYVAFDRLHEQPQQRRGAVIFDFDFEDTIACRLLDPDGLSGWYRLRRRDEGTLWCRGVDEIDVRALSVAFALSSGLRLDRVDYASHVEWFISLADRAA